MKFSHIWLAFGIGIMILAISISLIIIFNPGDLPETDQMRAVLSAVNQEPYVIGWLIKGIAGLGAGLFVGGFLGSTVGYILAGILFLINDFILGRKNYDHQEI